MIPNFLHRTRLILPIAIAALLGGCAPMLTQPDAHHMGYNPATPEPGIIVQTHQNRQLTFHDGWTLTFDGVAGTAEYADGDARIVADTTLSYGDIVYAAPARGSNTMRQFLLTILGVILLIGLAAIILYAAFIATGR